MVRCKYHIKKYFATNKGYPEGINGVAQDPSITQTTVAAQPPDGTCTDYYNQYWYAPAGTPKAIITRIHDVLSKQLATREAQELYLSQGHEPGGGDPEEYAAFIRAEIQKWAKVAKAANIRE